MIQSNWTTQDIENLLSRLDELNYVVHFAIGGLFCLIGMFVILLFIVGMKVNN